MRTITYGLLTALALAGISSAAAEPSPAPARAIAQSGSQGMSNAWVAMCGPLEKSSSADGARSARDRLMPARLYPACSESPKASNEMGLVPPSSSVSGNRRYTNSRVG